MQRTVRVSITAFVSPPALFLFIFLEPEHFFFILSKKCQSNCGISFTCASPFKSRKRTHIRLRFHETLDVSNRPLCRIVLCLFIQSVIWGCSFICNVNVRGLRIFINLEMVVRLRNIRVCIFLLISHL